MSAKAFIARKPVKPKKNIRNVLVQPFKTVWPTIDENEAMMCSSLVKQVNQKNVFTACNEVLQSLQTGTAAALLLDTSFHPKMFGKQIMQMARKQNASILILALPKLPFATASMLSVRKSSDDKLQQPLLELMETLCIEKGYLESNKDTLPGRKRIRRKKSSASSGVKSQETLVDVYLPARSDGRRAFEPKATEKPETKMETDDYIAFNSIGTNKATKVKKPTKSFKKTKSALRYPVVPYLPLTVNHVQGNPNRKAHVKNKKVK